MLCGIWHPDFLVRQGSSRKWFSIDTWPQGVKNADCDLSKVSITACLTVRIFLYVYTLSANQSERCV